MPKNKNKMNVPRLVLHEKSNTPIFSSAGLQRVEIKTQKTKFWRHQHEKPDTYLATIEAIYYFVVEFHKLFLRSEYVGEYDNLLFFFCFMYNKIKGLYDGGKYLKAYSKKS